MKIIFKIFLAAIFSLGLSIQSFAAECIAPANPGGGWDFTCRAITKIMHDIGAVDSPIQVTNMAGGGGGLAYTHVVNERNSDDNLIVAASSATATRLAQNKYSGMTSDQVRFLGAIGADPGVIVVGKDSPYQNLNDKKPIPISDAAPNQSLLGAYKRLINYNLVEISGFTPTDAAHVLKIFNGFCNEAAELGALIFSKKKYASGNFIAKSKEEFSEVVIKSLINKSAFSICDFVLSNETINFEENELNENFFLQEILFGEKRKLAQINLKINFFKNDVSNLGRKIKKNEIKKYQNKNIT